MPCPLAISQIVKPLSASTFFPSNVNETFGAFYSPALSQVYIIKD